MFRVGFGLFIP